MENTEKIQLFETTPIAKSVMTLSVPTVISSLVMVIYNLADTYFVGMLNDSVQSAAVTLAAPVLLAFNAVNNLFGVGSSSMMSRGLGSKDYTAVRESSVFGFYFALISGLLFSDLYTSFKVPLLKVLGADSVTTAATAEYLKWTVTCGAAPAILNVVLAYMVRSEGASLHASLGTMSGCILNIILDPILILPWGLNMGAAGAGLATFISNCIACLYFFVLLFIKRGRTYVCVDPRSLRFSRRIILGIFAVGIPASVQNLLNVTGMTVLNNFTADFSESAVAAMGIVQKVNMLPVQIAFGFSQGIMPLVSYNYASGNSARMKQSVMFTAKIMLVFLTVVTVFYYIFSGTLTEWFMKDAEVVAYGTKFLRGFCLGIPFLCIDFLAVGIFQACGFGRKALVFAILRKIVLEIPALFLL
ncbi:MAG: MATE family efflux transporter, partial [Oscillospiraceae bacterium]|nr:MATE family efflux transporter [Oscillospiraceae bacterium]